MRESLGYHETQGRNESEGAALARSAWVGSVVLAAAAHHRPVSKRAGAGAEQERMRWDPKDGELCPSRSKPEETLVEDRSDSDVQIDRPTWV